MHKKIILEHNLEAMFSQTYDVTVFLAGFYVEMSFIITIPKYGNKIRVPLHIYTLQGYNLFMIK